MTGAAEVAFLSKEALAGAKVIETIARIFRENKVEGGRFSEIINGIPLKIIETMNDMVTEIDALENKLKKEGLNLRMSPNQCEADMSFWQRNLLPNPLRSFNNKIYGFKNDITSMIENYIMIARCYERGALVENALKEALKGRNELDKVLNPDEPLERMLQNVRGYADSVRRAVNASGPRTA